LKTHWFQSAIDSIAERGRELLGLEHTDENKNNLYPLCQQLLTSQGEASGVALSQEILYVYEYFNNEEKLGFFSLLATEFNPNLKQLHTATENYFKSQSAKDLVDLNSAVEAPRQELFRRLNMAPNGTAKLVSFRADLLGVLKETPPLISVDSDLKHVLSSWFNRGFLQLRNIDWTSPAHILEKLINYESVHEIRDWHDLRRRLMKDRRCFAFFHPAMPDEPLIFIEVALVKGLADKITQLIETDATVLDPKQTDTAIFYSINNTQTGLRGISFGNFLIKQVLTELTHEFPWLKISSTLSPVPSFAASLQKWLSGDTSHEHDAIFEKITQQHIESIKRVATQHGLEPLSPVSSLLAGILNDYLEPTNNTLSELLGDLALAYLTTPGTNGKLSDPVAMFHLSNGARLERINTYADISAKGISNSHGVMVNYLYDLADVERNHEAFASKGRIVMSAILRKKYNQFMV